MNALKFLILNLLLAIGTVSSAQAQGSGGVGNGGDAEVQFVKISDEIQAWLKANQDAGLLGEKLKYSATDFYSRLSRVMKLTPVRFDDHKIEIAGASRVCANFKSPDQIQCDRAAWAATEGYIRYAIVLHEYLGILGLENNVADYSQYPISKNILDYVYAKTAFELGFDAHQTVAAAPLVFPTPTEMKKLEATSVEIFRNLAKAIPGQMKANEKIAKSCSGDGVFVVCEITDISEEAGYTYGIRVTFDHYGSKWAFNTLMYLEH